MPTEVCEDVDVEDCWSEPEQSCWKEPKEKCWEVSYNLPCLFIPTIYIRFQMNNVGMSLKRNVGRSQWKIAGRSVIYKLSYVLKMLFAGE